MYTVLNQVTRQIKETDECINLEECSKVIHLKNNSKMLCSVEFGSNKPCSSQLKKKKFEKGELEVWKVRNRSEVPC